jgi:hypothetical protein
MQPDRGAYVIVEGRIATKSSPVVLFKIKSESAACVEFKSDASQAIGQIQEGAQHTR